MLDKADFICYTKGMKATALYALLNTDPRLAEKFTASTVTDGDCLLWTKTVGIGGYGRFSICKDGKVYTAPQAHRLAVLLSGRSLTDADVVRHTCDNTRCVNPEHLVVGSRRENMVDMVSRQRHRPWGREPLSLITIREWAKAVDAGRTFGDIAKEAGKTRWTVYRAVHRYKAKSGHGWLP